MRKIAIDTDVLRSQADQLEACVSKMDDDLTRATQLISVINESTSLAMRMSTDVKVSLLEAIVNSLKDTMRTGITLARQCADEFQNADVENKRNIDQIIRDNVDDLPQTVTESTVSNQRVIHVEDQVYNQHEYDKFIEYYQGKQQNTGCGLCAASYALSIAGYSTTPDDAYVASGYCMNTNWIAIGKCHENVSWAGFRYDPDAIPEVAKQMKTEGNISPFVLRTANNSHYVVLKDVDLDSTGNITKYYFFDPSGGKTIETSSLDEFKSSTYYGDRTYNTIDSFGYYIIN
ncbi:MAG: hypothetical protein VZR27_08335 [Acutalibacteraceae bacterium]|nr:hypothetical protein [Acutalibacteraceae bacterium]